MIKSRNVERALHLWKPWINGVKEGRAQANKLAQNLDQWVTYADKSLREMRLPTKSLLKTYYLCCIFSDYGDDFAYSFDKIQLPQFLFPLADKFWEAMAQGIWVHHYVRTFLRTTGTRLKPDLENLRNRPYPPAIWNRSDVEFASRWEQSEGPANTPVHEILRRYYSPCYMVLANDHPLLSIASNIKRGRDDTLALHCAELKGQGYSYAEIGEKFGWKLQADDYVKMTRCSTAQRYVSRGRELQRKD